MSIRTEARDRVDLSSMKMLLGCLAFDRVDPPAAGRDGGVNERNSPDRDWPSKSWHGLIAAGLMTRLLPALVDRFRLEETSAPDCKSRLDIWQLGLLPESFAYRRHSQRVQLVSGVGALNAAGIEPLLMSAAQDVWLDVNSWRFVEDLGIHVECRSHGMAEAVLRELGYQRVRAMERARYRMETCWSHPQTSGYLVLRGAGSNRTIERLMPSRDLLSWSETVKVGDATARVLPAPVDALLALIHHHFGRTRADAIAVAPKELYEFSRAARGLNDEQQQVFWDLLGRHRELHNPATAWLDAAERCFGLRLPRHAGAEQITRGPATAEHACDREIAFLGYRGGYRIALRAPTGLRARFSASFAGSAFGG